METTIVGESAATSGSPSCGQEGTRLEPAWSGPGAGVTATSLSRWTRPAGARAGFRAVEVVGEVEGGERPLVLVTPEEYRVEGLPWSRFGYGSRCSHEVTRPPLWRVRLRGSSRSAQVFKLISKRRGRETRAHFFGFTGRVPAPG